MQITKAATAVAALTAVLIAGEAAAFTISPGNLRVTIDTFGAGEGGSQMQCSIDGRCETTTFGATGAAAGNAYASNAIFSAGALADIAAAQKTSVADATGTAFVPAAGSAPSVALASAAFAHIMLAGDVVGSSFTGSPAVGQRATSWADYGRMSAGGGLANGAHTLASRTGNDLAPIVDSFGTTGRMRRLGDFGYPLVAGAASVVGALSSVSTLTDATAVQQNALQSIVSVTGNANTSADASSPKVRLAAAADVPEPSSLALVGLAVFALAGFGRTWKSRR